MWIIEVDGEDTGREFKSLLLASNYLIKSDLKGKVFKITLKEKLTEQ